MDEQPPDARFSLANERTYLAWIRTSLALLAGGVAAAKGLRFDHELVRWLVSVPPILAGAVVAAGSVRHWRGYEQAMRRGEPLPVGTVVTPISLALAVYALVVLVAVVVDG